MLILIFKSDIIAFLRHMFYFLLLYWTSKSSEQIILMIVDSKIAVYQHFLKKIFIFPIYFFWNFGTALELIIVTAQCIFIILI